MLDARQIALNAYCERVMERLDCNHKIPLGTLSKLTTYIAREQTAAFSCGISSEECARWIARQIMMCNPDFLAGKPQ